MELMKVPDKLVLFAVVAVAAILSVSCVTGKNADNLHQTSYKRILVPSTVLPSDGLKEEFHAFSRIACVQRAKAHHWYHLACFTDDRICSIYDFNLPSNYRTDAENPTDLKCYTDLPEGCENDNKFYLDGESRMENCNNMTCTNKTWIPTLGELKDCPDGFESVHGVGCIIFVQKVMHFEENIVYCNETLGARLVIPEDYEVLRRYVICTHSKTDGTIYRVGIQNSKWMDGRSVDDDSWHPGQPDNVNDWCGYMGTGNRKLYNYNCNLGFLSICQLV